MSVAGKVETCNNFIGGKWKPSPSGETFDDENPAFRGSNIASFQSSTIEDVREAIDAAQSAFETWRRTPLSTRQHYVAEFLRLLKDSREELARIVTLENGKTIRESRAEVDSALVEGSTSVLRAHSSDPLRACLAHSDSGTSPCSCKARLKSRQMPSFYVLQS